MAACPTAVSESMSRARNLLSRFRLSLSLSLSLAGGKTLLESTLQQSVTCRSRPSQFMASLGRAEFLKLTVCMGVDFENNPALALNCVLANIELCNALSAKLLDI